MNIPFNKPYLTGKETEYIEQAVRSGKISGDGDFSKRCQKFFEQQYEFGKCLLTTSCTDALEMAALLLEVGPGDEVIIPSFTFVSTANAFVLRGAKVVFADCGTSSPNIDPQHVEQLITPNTKAIVVVHYAGVACDMDAIQEIADKHGIAIVEDAAHAIDAYYKKRPLGSIGRFAALSFHETKNIISGEGGAIAINDKQFVPRAEIIREKGTNRSAFFRGEVDKYNWVDVGSSFLPSEIVAAFLYAQIENLERIQKKRLSLWNAYQTHLQVLADLGLCSLPEIPEYATNNGHMFYLVCKDLEERNRLIEHLTDKGILAVFHYLSLHQSPFYLKSNPAVSLPNCERFSDCLVRLPLFFELTFEEVNFITNEIKAFYKV